VRFLTSKAPAIAALVCIAIPCAATLIKEVTFEDLVASSTQIVSGHVTRSWTSWGSEHKLIWTRYEVAVDDVIAGEPASTVVMSEPGGVLDGQGMRVESAVRYTIGEHVVLFLQQYPGGDKRTVGWSQGKFTVDESNRVHSSAGAGYLPNHLSGTPNGTRIGSLDGITYRELSQRAVELYQRRVAR
jgi:hypothetical protein